MKEKQKEELRVKEKLQVKEELRVKGKLRVKEKLRVTGDVYGLGRTGGNRSLHHHCFLNGSN